jgi:hypothetical protein
VPDVCRYPDMRLICIDSKKNIVYKLINESFLFEICSTVDDFIQRLQLIKNNKLLKKLNFILPIDLIYTDGKFRGYSMTYFESERLQIENNYNHIIIWLENIQKRLEYNINFDMNFRNFLIDKNNNVMVCDVDSMQINEFHSTFAYFDKEEYRDYRTSYFLIARVIERACQSDLIQFDEFLKDWISKAMNYKLVVLSQLINHLRNKKGPH